MKAFNDGWLIATAPAEVLLGILVFALVAGLILFLLAVEAGYYPSVSRAISAVRNRFSAIRCRIAAFMRCWREVRYVEG